MDFLDHLPTSSCKRSLWEVCGPKENYCICEKVDANLPKIGPTHYNNGHLSQCRYIRSDESPFLFSTHLQKRLTLIDFCCLFVASGHSIGCQKNTTAKNRQSRLICLGNKRSTFGPESLRSKFYPVSIFYQQNFKKRWTPTGSGIAS